MLPSERAIESAIERLSAGEFQRLVEAYARQSYPRRFRTLTVHGRNSSMSTIAGWPDAFAVDVNGCLDVVEATRDIKNWRAHLRKDIDKAARLSTPGLGGFLFASWAPSPDPGLLIPLRDRLRVMGVAYTKITFVFRQQLVADLRQPHHANLWATLLSLNVSPLPFVRLDRAPIYGDPAQSLFAPAREDYRCARVYHSAIKGDVMSLLRGRSWAVVSGLGASGKTTFAAVTGYQWLARGDPAYYLDLLRTVDRSGLELTHAAANAIATYAAHNVLFIVDNIHADRPGTASLFDAWKHNGHGSQLLLLGRETANSGASLGLVSPIINLDRDAVQLKVGRDDLAGTFRRIYATSQEWSSARRLTRPRRRGGRRKPPDRDVTPTYRVPKPPNAALSRWLKIFGGDLIAFSAALQRRQPGPSDWTLHAADAREYVSDRYLAPLSDRQRTTLVAVADWSSLELARPRECTDRTTLGPVIASGLIHVTESPYQGFSTVHPGVGVLIVASSGNSLGDIVVRDAENVSSEFALLAVDRLMARGDPARAREALRPHLSSCKQITLAVLGRSGTKSPPWLARAVEETLEELPQVQSELQHAAADAIREVSGPRLIRFMRWASECGAPLLYTALRDATGQLEASERGRLVEEISGWIMRNSRPHTPLSLRSVRRHLPSLHGLLADSLAEKNALTRFFGASPAYRSLRAPRWTDLIIAARVSGTFRVHLVDELLRHPSVLVRIPDEPRLRRELADFDPALAIAITRSLGD